MSTCLPLDLASWHSLLVQCTLLTIHTYCVSAVYILMQSCLNARTPAAAGLTELVMYDRLAHSDICFVERDVYLNKCMQMTQLLACQLLLPCMSACKTVKELVSPT